MDLNERFVRIVEGIKQLEEYDRYAGAFVFGSVARREATEDSDLDIKVITRDIEINNVFNHPFIFGMKIDITFGALSKLPLEIAREASNGWRPMIVGSIILFDKTGDLVRLREQAGSISPQNFTENDLLKYRIECYHTENRIKDNLVKDPMTALLTMHTSIEDLFKFHYRFHEKWWIGSKRLLSDLDMWDRDLAVFLRLFLKEHRVTIKYGFWSDIVDYVLSQIGGKLAIDGSCSCTICSDELSHFRILGHAE